MKLQTRKRIFYVFFLLFFVIGAAVVFYAEGWRIDPSTFQTEKVGGIFIRSFPDNAQITLDGKPVQNQTAFLSQGTFITSLFPKTYTLQLKEPDYDAWTENAQVSPALVAEMKYAVLVPATATNVATSVPNVNAFFEIGGDVVADNTSGTITWHGAAIGNGTVVSHSADLKTAIIRSTTNAKSKTASYSLYDFTATTSTNLSAILLSAGITPTPTLNVFIDPYNDTGILVQTPSKIVGIDSETYVETPIETAPAGVTIESPIAVSPSVMAWARFSTVAPTTTSSLMNMSGATSTSQIMVYDKFSGNTIDDSLVVPGPVKQLAWIKNNELGILESNNSLYLYNVPNEKLTKLADDVKQFYPTSDGTAIAALEYNSLEVFVFPTSDYYRFALPDATNVQGLTWYKDETHLFVQYADHVSFLDLADTNLKNFTTVSEGTDAEYDVQENSLYLIDQGQKLLRFDFPQ
jgi:hypothetical protein